MYLACAPSSGLWALIKRDHLRPFELKLRFPWVSQAEKENLLTSRSVLSLWAYVNDEDDAKQVQELKDLYHDPPTGNLRMTQVKVRQVFIGGGAI